MSGQFEERSRTETAWDRCGTFGHTANGGCQIRVGMFLGLGILISLPSASKCWKLDVLVISSSMLALGNGKFHHMSEHLVISAVWQCPRRMYFLGHWCFALFRFTFIRTLSHRFWIESSLHTLLLLRLQESTRISDTKPQRRLESSVNDHAMAEIFVRIGSGRKAGYHINL
jgi:hypothetical protein